MHPNVLLCTIGTSLFFPNLEGLRTKLAGETLEPEFRGLANAYQAGDWNDVAECLAERDPNERLCGAEINSVASMISHGYVPDDMQLHFFHSATDDGRNVAAVLQHFFRTRGHPSVNTQSVPGLQDTDPKQFCQDGLKNLACQMADAIRAHTPAACAINATGGFKAQIAVAVLLGQALDVPVYYKHERFNEIIDFPPSALNQWLGNNVE